MVHPVKVLTAKIDDLSSNPRDHMMDRSAPTSCPLGSVHTVAYTNTHRGVSIYNKQTNNKCKVLKKK